MLQIKELEPKKSLFSRWLNLFCLIIFSATLLYFHFKANSSQWFCKEGASSRNHNTYEICGIGQEKSEEDARKTALKNAFEEFDLVCNNSDDCKNKYKQVSPLRTDCEAFNGGYKCYRAFYIIVGEKLKLKETKSKIDNELNELRSQNARMEKKIKEGQLYLTENKELVEKLSEVEKLASDIRKKVKSKNQIIESYLKRGMSLKEVFQILNPNSNTRQFLSLDDDGYFIYGTYRIHFNMQENLENSPILEAACDMNSPDHCINIEP